MAKTPTVELIAEAGCDVGESPVWDDRLGSLWWVDLPKGDLYEYRWSDGSYGLRAAIGESIGFIVPLDGSSFATGTTNAMARLGIAGDLEVMSPLGEERPGYRINDGKCDHQGLLWVGTVSDDVHDGGRLYNVGPGWRASLAREGMKFPNGMAWSGDGKVMCVADTDAGTLEFWECDPSEGSPRRIVHRVETPSSLGQPDGMTVDAEDCFWVAIWGGGRVQRYTVSGELLMEIVIPAPLTASCAFGGENLDELFVTTARYRLTPTMLAAWPLSGSVFRAYPGVAGLLPDAYRS
jgi:sugar lactone lactonase YvrE